MLRGCLKRVTAGIIYHQDGAKVLESEAIILLDSYSLTLSLTFQTTSKKSVQKTVLDQARTIDCSLPKPGFTQKSEQLLLE
jgi:hypothetical protein